VLVLAPNIPPPLLVVAGAPNAGLLAPPKGELPVFEPNPPNPPEVEVLAPNIGAALVVLVLLDPNPPPVFEPPPKPPKEELLLLLLPPKPKAMLTSRNEGRVGRTRSCAVKAGCVPCARAL